MKLPRAHHLSAEELAGQVLMPKLEIGFRNIHAAPGQKILRLLKRYHIGGFILFNGHPADIRYWTALLQRESRFPLLIGADLERGLGSVFSSGTLFPHALAFGAAGDENLLKSFAEVLGKEARAVGINLFFGPVLDLANDPENPIVNIRAFHSQPAIVSRYAQIVIKTVQQFGIACVGKHFPGHGATRQDSHTNLPEIYKSLAELEAEELLPFREALAADIKGLMAGHLKAPGYPLPASLEPGLIEEIIRRQWNYRGVVFTDALDMGAIQQHFHPWEQALLPLQAGADVLLMPPQLPLAHSLLVEEIQTNEAFRSRVEEAVERIFALKRWLHAHQPAQDHPLRVNKVIEHPGHTGDAAKAAEKAITLLHQSERFPLDLAKVKQVFHLIFTDSIFHDQPLKHFCRKMETFFDNLRVLNNPASKDIQSLSLSADTVAIVSLYFRTFAGHSQELDWAQVGKTLRHLRRQNAPLIIFLFGNPYQLDRLPENLSPDALFLVYSYVQASQEAAFRALCSFIPVQGHLPVPLKKPFGRALHCPPKFYRPERLSTPLPDWKAVDDLINRAIEERIFPGCVALAVQRGQILLHRAYGRFDYPENAPAVKPDTLYDLASLTKVLATTPAVMLLVEQGELRLDQPLGDFYPQLQGDPKAGITIADLLSHQSGLPAWKPFYEDFGFEIGKISSPEGTGRRVNRKFASPSGADGGLQKKREIVKKVLNTPLEYEIGEKALYSDLGFILLYDLVEKISSLPFAVFCRNRIFQPLELRSLQFNPPEKLRKQIPPTGADALRKEVIQGQVNDANCFAMGGISGHAGLFGHAEDVAAIGQLFIQKGIYNARRLFRASTIDLFTRKHRPAISARALGWDTAVPGGSAGNHFSENTIGHLGFTGTSLWIDLAREIIVVLLCNRVHPDPAKNRMGEIRPRLHDAICEILCDK